MQGLTFKEKTLLFMSDGQFHTVAELIPVYYKYTQRFWDLEKDGLIIDDKPNPNRSAEKIYKLVLDDKALRAIKKIKEKLGYVSTENSLTSNITTTTKQPKQDKLFEVRGTYV